MKKRFLVCILILFLAICATTSAEQMSVTSQVHSSDCMELSDLECKYDPAAKQLYIKGIVNGSSDVGAVRIASWMDNEPTAEEARKSAQNMTSIWKQSENTISARTLPFQISNSRPVDNDDLGKTQYIILAGLDSSLNLVGYAVIQVELPESYESPKLNSPVIQQKPQSVQVGERFAVSLTADERSRYTTLYLYDSGNNYIGFEHLEGASGNIKYSRWPDNSSAGVYTCRLVSYGENYQESDEVVFQLTVTEGDRPEVPTINISPESPTTESTIMFVADGVYDGIILELYRNGSRYSGFDVANTDRIEWPMTLPHGAWIAKIAVCVDEIWSYWCEMPFTVGVTNEYIPVPVFEGCDGRSYTVSLDYPDLKETYPVNLDETIQDRREYAWGFKFTDGTYEYEVTTCHFKPDSTSMVIPVTHMQSDLWVISESSFTAIDSVKLRIRDTSLVWTFDVPEEADLSKLRITQAFVQILEENYYGYTEVDISSGGNGSVLNPVTMDVPEGVRIPSQSVCEASEGWDDTLFKENASVFYVNPRDDLPYKVSVQFIQDQVPAVDLEFGITGTDADPRTDKDTQISYNALHFYYKEGDTFPRLIWVTTSFGAVDKLFDNVYINMFYDSNGEYVMNGNASLSINGMYIQVNYLHGWELTDDVKNMMNSDGLLEQRLAWLNSYQPKPLKIRKTSCLSIYDLLSISKVLNLPTTLQEIESQAFIGVDADKVIIPSTVQTIADDAFDEDVLLVLPDNRLQNWAIKNHPNYEIAQ